MESFIIQLLLSLGIFVISFFGTLFWLSIPLILQVIIDKVIVQNSPDSLNDLGIALLMLTLIASAFEIGLAAFTAALIRSHLVSREIFLQLAATLPKVSIFLVVMVYYSPQLAVASTVLTAIACGAYFFLKRSRIGAELNSNPLPLSFRLPLTLIVLFILWYGTSLILDGQLTLGQWTAIGIFNLQFVASLLSLTAAAIRGQKSNELIEPV
jgi:ABC-type bacteriocin/lantibiotic exporter with double-glycine peptidase domain